MKRKTKNIPRDFKRADKMLADYKAGRWIRRNAEGCVRDLVWLAGFYRDCAVRRERRLRPFISLQTFLEANFSPTRRKKIEAAAARKIKAIRAAKASR